MSRVRDPRDEWSRINDLERRISNLERSNPFQRAQIQAADGSIVWSSDQAASMAVAPVPSSGVSTVGVTGTDYTIVGSFAWVAGGAWMGQAPRISVPVYVVPPAGGTAKVRILDASGVGVVIDEQTGIDANGYVVLRGQLGETTGSTGAVSLVQVEAAIESGSGTLDIRLDATASVH